jgi:heterodisulfide reductase subunit A-like polyferredoxin
MIHAIDHEKCTGCGICVEICPLDTLRLDPFRAEIPPCREGCPGGVDIRGWMHFLKQGMFDEACRLLQRNIPLPAITGRLCTHPCEARCARGKWDEAVNIRLLERYVGDVSLRRPPEPPLRAHAGRVAVIGSGPAGLSTAFFLIATGYPVTVFEANASIGGALRREVAEGRLPERVLEDQIAQLRQVGIEFKTGRGLGRDWTLKHLKEERYRAVVLCLGTPSDGNVPFHHEVFADGKNLLSPVDPVTLETPLRGVFAAGSGVTGMTPLVNVIASAKRAAGSVDRYLRAEPGRPAPPEKAKRVQRFSSGGMLKIPRRDHPTALTEEEAIEEARRCMACGSRAFIAHPEDCMTCYECELKCPTGAIDVHPFKEKVTLTLPLS